MYWLTRSVITSQAEITTMTVMKAVSGTNHIDRPSTPSAYFTLKRSIQGSVSRNCIAAVVVSKPTISGSVTRKLTSEPISAIQRTASALSSRPMASSRTPQAIGSQMARLSKPMFLFSVPERYLAIRVPR